MAPLLDYAVDAFGAMMAPAPAPTPESGGIAPLTVAALFERHQASLPITDAMIDDACRNLRTAESLFES